MSVRTFRIIRGKKAVGGFELTSSESWRILTNRNDMWHVRTGVSLMSKSFVKMLRSSFQTGKCQDADLEYSH